MDALVVLPRQGFDDDDLLYINKKFDLSIATINKEPAIGKKGTIVLPDYDIKDLIDKVLVKPNVLFIIGDEGIKDLETLEIKTLSAGYLVPGKLLVAIGLAPILLAKFRIIYGKTISYKRKLGDYDYFLRNLGVTPSPLNYSIDDNLITLSRGKFIDVVEGYVREHI